MKFRLVVLGCLILGCLTAVSGWSAAPRLEAAESLTQHGITWHFDKAYPTGQFATGDPWVVGPVAVVRISTDLHAAGFQPGPHDDGSMVNPAADGLQGYDGSLSSYREQRNAARPNGRPLSPENPLVLPPHSSLVSMVSWLYTSEANKEPGTPGFNGTTKAPRPVTRSGAILTVLPAAPRPDSFRPAYCGNDKTIRFRKDDLAWDRLKNLPPVPSTPDPGALAERIARPWIDHVHEFMGAMIHPSENMPNYGRDMGKILADAALLANVDVTRLPSGGDKRDLVIRLVQFGIDSAGVADAGGGWPENGGHGLGRKFPILFAGLLLNDPHMQDVGHWETRFQDDEQTFYVTRESVEITHSSDWRPDARALDKQPYELADIGMPEWGIRHTRRPTADNRGWRTPYRDINGAIIPGFALAASIMQCREAWNHEPYFDYAARCMHVLREGERREKGTNRPSVFVEQMWDRYHQQFGLDGSPRSVIADGTSAGPAIVDQ